MGTAVNSDLVADTMGGAPGTAVADNKLLQVLEEGRSSVVAQALSEMDPSVIDAEAGTVAVVARVGRAGSASQSAAVGSAEVAAYRAVVVGLVSAKTTALPSNSASADRALGEYDAERTVIDVP